MITLELISKKRKPIKQYALYSIIGCILLLGLIGLFGKHVGNNIKIFLMLVIACLFMVSLFIINYSINFKNKIGYIHFKQNQIEIDVFQKREIIELDKIKSIRFKLSGYEGLSNSSIFESVMWFPTLFSYHTGMNNFVHINSVEKIRSFEFFIPNKKSWLLIKRVENLYKQIFNK